MLKNPRIWACIVCGIIAAIFLAKGAKDSYVLSQEGVATKGTIVSMQRNNGGKSGVTYTVNFTFEANGRECKGSDSLAPKMAGHLKVGSKVPLVYQKGNPSLAKLGKPGDLWETKGKFSPLFYGQFVLLGVVFLFMYLKKRY